MTEYVCKCPQCLKPDKNNVHLHQMFTRANLDLAVIFAVADAQAKACGHEFYCDCERSVANASRKSLEPESQ